MKELQNLIEKWEKEVTRIETNIKDSDDEAHKRLNFHMKRQLRHCITDLKKLNTDVVKQDERFCDCEIPMPMARNLDNSTTCITCRRTIEQN